MTKPTLTKSDRVKEVVIAVLNKHAADPDGLPTTPRFIFYELEQRGEAQKPSPDDQRRNRRRSVGWPPGSQDVTDALTVLRNSGELPWNWLADTERRVSVWRHAATVADYIRDRLPEARINPWGDEPPPLLLTESNGMALALARVASEFLCPVAGLKGQTNGFLHTVIAPLLSGNDRRVLFLGDLDRSGIDIEINALTVLMDAADRVINWTRIGLIAGQTDGIEPIWKVDGRDGVGEDAWEVEALGQAAVVALVRSALDARLPEPLERVREREEAQRDELREVLEGLE